MTGFLIIHRGDWFDSHLTTHTQSALQVTNTDTTYTYTGQNSGAEVFEVAAFFVVEM